MIWDISNNAKVDSVNGPNRLFFKEIHAVDFSEVERVALH